MEKPHILRHMHRPHFKATYMLMLLLSFHYCLALYTTSSYLNLSFSSAGVSALYAAGSILTIWIFLKIPALLRRIGNYRIALWTIVMTAIAVFGIISGSPLAIAASFIAYQAFISIIFLNLDIFLENFSKNESRTGLTRGIFLTLSNVAFVVAPFLAGKIVGTGNYRLIYLVSLIFLIPLFFITYRIFRDFKDAAYHNSALLRTAREYLHHPDMYRIWIVNFILQLFYAVMIIYTPIYLHQHVGFSWEQIGLIFSIMLIPFVLFELPVGELADRVWGEKELLVTGLLVCGSVTFFLASLESTSLAVWAIALFATRIGASFIEITSESYFFKHTKGSHADMISFFRHARPLSFLAAPVAGAIIISFFSYQFLFAFIGAVVLSAIIFALRIEDTR